ncbi:hypothetical protein GCM10023318_51120 [Nocardia callitridis]|uniref:Uncharacterized protein n=1 Tax=Nocardia callitridis TaxID=648753 RepID=A0ABP9KVM6_9NOCA
MAPLAFEVDAADRTDFDAVESDIGADPDTLAHVVGDESDADLVGRCGIRDDAPCEEYRQREEDGADAEYPGAYRSDFGPWQGIGWHGVTP